MSRKIPRKGNQFKLPVLAIIVNNAREVLLVLRNNPKTKYSHLKWAFPGGGIEFGEHPLDTVKREVFEEVGIEIEVDEDSLFLENHIFENEKIQSLCICYLAQYKNGKLDFSKDKKTKDARWFKIEEISYELCLPKTKEILSKALKYYGK